MPSNCGPVVEEVCVGLAARDRGSERLRGGDQRIGGVVFLIFWSPGCIVGRRRMERCVGERPALGQKGA